MKRVLFVFSLTLTLTTLFGQKDSTLSKDDLQKDVLMKTSMGDIIIRLSDSTPLHRDNFLKLVKVGFYDSLLFHRVINGFMIQGGDPDSKRAVAGQLLGNGGPGYMVPAEFKPSLFHKRGVIAAARLPDNMNPEKASSGSQFYLAQGRKWSDAGLDSIETYRLRGQKMPVERRQAYKTVGGIPFLDDNYTVYGEVIQGIEVIDTIAAVPTATMARPVEDVRIISATLIKRKKTTTPIKKGSQ